MTKTLKGATTTPPPCNDILSKCLIDKCRVCLKAGEIYIFGANDIAAVVQEFGGIQVCEKDKRPQHLCDTCHSLLEGAIIFRQRAQKSELILSKVNDYLIDQNEVALPSPCTDNESSNIESIISNIKKLSDSMYSGLTESPNASENLPQRSDESNMSFETESVSDSNEGGNNRCEYLEYSIYSTDEESGEDLIAKDSQVDITSTIDVNISNKIQGLVTCAVCQKEVSKIFYKNHMKLHRAIYKKKANKNAARRMECSICYKMVSYTYFKYHMKMHGSEAERAQRYRECPVCAKTLSANYYNEHMKRVHENDPTIIVEKKKGKKQSKMECPVCDKTVKANQFKEHLAKHGKPPKKYVCEKCGMSTMHPSAFKTHCLTHGSELKYKCQYCPYRGLHLGLLKIHERTHTGEYNYKCQMCSAKFLTKSNLTQHQRVHRLPIDFICNECNRGFYTKRALDRHYNTIHLKDKSNVCDTCGKGFGHRDILLSHQLKVHNRKRIVTKGRLPSYLRPEHIVKQQQN